MSASNGRPVIDLTGQTFGKLLVLSNAGKDKGGKYMWNCLCECGNTAVVLGNNLRSGRTKSCGHCPKGPQDDLTGRTFGDLLVLGLAGKDKNSRYVWNCKCKCGRNIDVPGYRLKNGAVTSCGHCKDVSYGERYGKLTVIERSTKKSSSGAYLWKCICDCGSIVYVTNANLKRGHTKSCGHCSNALSGPRENLTGKTIGKLKVLGLTAGRDQRGRYYYNCKCSCGNFATISAENLKKGTVTSCGHCKGD